MQGAKPQIEADLATLVAGQIDPKKFPHSEHLRFAYEMLSRHSFAETVSLFSAGLKKLAAKSGGLPVRFLIYGASAFLIWRLTSLLEGSMVGT